MYFCITVRPIITEDCELNVYAGKTYIDWETALWQNVLPVCSQQKTVGSSNGPPIGSTLCL
jgi:hypothetical protein